MRQNTLNTLLATATLSLAVGAAAHGQELLKSEEHRLAQDTQQYFVMGPAYGKLTFEAAGAATDLVVIRLADGSVFATATIEQLLKGITGDHKVPGSEPTEGSGGEGGVKPGETKPEYERPAEEKPAEGDSTGVSSGAKKSIELTKPVYDGSAVELGPIADSDEDNLVEARSLTAPFELLRAQFTFASIPWAFHGGSVSIYRGVTELDRDTILLY